MRFKLVAGAPLAVLSFLMAPLAAHAALVSTDGGLAVYDNTLNASWISDATLLETQASTYSGGSSAYINAVIHDYSGAFIGHTLTASDFHTNNGTMDIYGAIAFVNYLDVTKYGGTNTWALPSTVNNNASRGYPNGLSAPGDIPQSTSQMAELFYNGLGVQRDTPIYSHHNASYSLFTHLGSVEFWSGTASSATKNWDFNTTYEYQYDDTIGTFDYVLAIAPGKVSAVPLPAGVWLLVSALGGLAVTMRRRAA